MGKKYGTERYGIGQPAGTIEESCGIRIGRALLLRARRAFLFSRKEDFPLGSLSKSTGYGRAERSSAQRSVFQEFRTLVLWFRLM